MMLLRILLLGILCFSPVTSSTYAAPQNQPNIVLILVDDLGWSDLGCQGHPWHRTPNIDRLASQGIRFTNGYSPAPICSAARSSILTGKTVARLGFEFVTKEGGGGQKVSAETPLQTPPFTLRLPLEERTIAEELSDLGYQTAFFGKWHVSEHYQRYLGWHPEYGPKKQGFETAIEDFGDHPYSWGKNKPKPTQDKTFSDDSMVNRVVDYLSIPKEKPFFLMCSSFYVHTPVKNRCRWLVDYYDTVLPQDIPARKNRLEYAALVETLDHHVGQILTAIDQSPEADNTLVVFISDNGGHPEYCGNEPLRGSKWNLYEGGIRVPLMARWPKKISSGTTCSEPVIGYDLLPTFVAAAGGTPPQLDGVSLLPLFENPQQQLPERALIWHFPYYHPERGFAKALDEIGISDFKTSKTRPQSAIRIGNYKLLSFKESEHIELYDLSQDLSEQTDLREKHPQIAAQMAEKLNSELKQMNARLATWPDSKP